MQVIRANATFTPFTTVQADCKKWVKFPETDWIQHGIILFTGKGISIEQLKAKTLKLDTTTFRTRTDNGEQFAAIIKPNDYLQPKHFKHDPKFTSWWYKPVWD